MKTINKNIIDAAIAGDVPCIFHQANCQSVMGAGLAKQIKSRCPDAYKAYMDDKNKKLGGWSVGKVNDCYVVNLYGQDRYGRNKRHTNYAAVCMSLCSAINQSGLKSFGIPKNVGCVNGGGSWFVMEDILIDIEKMMNIEFIIYDYG